MFCLCHPDTIYMFSPFMILVSDLPVLPARAHTFFGRSEADDRRVFPGTGGDAGSGCEKIGQGTR